jgi:hypothetical protein
MTDETEFEKPEKPVKLKGFANPNQRKNIRGGGRTLGSTNKKTTLTSKQHSDLILSNTTEGMQILMKLMRNGSEATKKSMVAKLLDHALSITIHNDKMEVARLEKEALPEAPEDSEGRSSGKSATILKLKI